MEAMEGSDGRACGFTTHQAPPPAAAAAANPGTAAAAATVDVIVIGGGVGGLATAGRLAKAGLSVTVLEKNGEVGVRAQSVELGGCRFDTGPSLLLFPDKYKEAFQALGSRLEEHVTIKRVEPAAYRVWFGDGTHLDLLNDHDAMAEQLERVERGAGEAFRRFVAMARASLDMGMPNFIERDFNSLSDARALGAALLPLLPQINLLDLLAPHDARLKRFFRDPRLRAMFTFQDLYVGLTPYTAPAVFSLLAGTELTDGVWYPLGGFGQVVKGLAAAAQACGARIKTDCEVVRILTDPAGGAATGVQLSNGDILPARAVVCNRDLPAAYELLLPNGASMAQLHRSAGSDSSSISSKDAGTTSTSSHATTGRTKLQEYARDKSKQLGGLQYSTGVISFNWCVDRRLERLRHHNVFLSDDYKQSWVPAATPAQLCRRPNFYCHVPARTDPSAAPEGCDSVMVLLPVANMQQRSGDYPDLVAAGRQRVLQAFKESGVGDIEASISHELVITPDQWTQRYGLRHGAAFGLAHGLDQLSVFRPGSKDSRIKGLYFVGASSRPGNGVPLCLISGKLTAERVLSDWPLV
ncbi:hypothetical protein N2152v2_003496 [Parachlorella kessleri]